MAGAERLGYALNKAEGWKCYQDIFFVTSFQDRGITGSLKC